MLGDHIRALKDGRWVHGIDLGDQRVLYLAEQPGLAPGSRLQRVYRPEFTAGAARVELVVHRERTYPARAVVARAWSRFMNASVVAMFADSEQFAAWCKIGRMPEPTAAAAPAPARKPARQAKAPARAKAAAARKSAGRPVPKRAAPKKSARKGTPRRVARKGARAPRKALARPSQTRKAPRRKGRR